MHVGVDVRRRHRRTLRIVGPLLAAALAAVLPVYAPAAHAANPIAYPDLINIIPTSDLTITHPTPTTREFDYTHIIYNGGLGPLEIQPTNYNPQTNLANAVQNLYSYASADSNAKTLASTHQATDTFFFHAAHNHFHFPLATFGLYGVNADGSIGQAVAVSPKNGFCVADDDRVDYQGLPHAPVTASFYTGAACTDPSQAEGISSGYGDHYDREDPGQAIDVTNVPDGTYWFHSVVDPDNNFLESDKSNNVTNIKLRISGDTVTPISPLVSQGSFVFDQSFLVDATGTTARTPAFNTSSPNELLVAFVAADATGTQTSTVTGGGLSWTLTRRTNVQTGTAEIWTAMAASPLSNATVTSTLSASGRQSMTVFAIKGAAGIGAVGGASSPGSPPAMSLTTTQPGSWVMAVGNDPDLWDTHTPSAGQTMVHQWIDMTGAQTTFMEAAPAPSSTAGTTVAFAHSYPTVYQWNMAAVEILPAASNDHTPPMISNPTVTSILPDRATVNWTTDEPATSQIEYGTTPALGSSTPLNPALITTHSVTVTGLTPNTTYDYQIDSTDSGGNTANLGALSFTTAPPGTAPPQFSNVHLTDVEADQATISWNTSVATNGSVQFGITAGYGRTSSVDTTIDTVYFVTITSLLPSTVYHYQVVGTDNYANTGASADFSFQTQAIPPPIAVDVRASADGTGTQTTPPFKTAVPGETLVVFVAADAAGPSVQSATVSGGGLTWTRDVQANSQAGDAEAWHAFATSKLTNVRIASTLAVPTFNQSLTVIAFEGAVDVGHTAAAGAATGAPTAQITTTGAKSVIYAVGADPDQATTAVSVAGQTITRQVPDAAGGNTFWLQSLDGDAGTVDNHLTIGDTAPNGDHWNLAVVEIRRPISVPPPAQTVPKISQLRVSSVTTTSAILTWTTNSVTTAQVVFGPTKSYGSTSAVDLLGGTNHQVMLTGLVPRTRYHFEILSGNGVGTAPLRDHSFATRGPGVPKSVVATPGVGQVTLKWKKAPAPSTVPVRAYVVTPYLNGLAQSPLSFDTSILQRIIGGLVGGGSYTFTVTAQNADGFGVASPLSAPVVPM